jgi:hypothetical protein
MKKQKFILIRFLSTALFLILFINWVYAQNSPSSVSTIYDKVLSGRLFEKINTIEKLSSTKLKSSIVAESKVFLYFSEYPSDDQIKLLETYGVKLMKETWTPPLENHPFGFIAATVPDINLQKVGWP